MGLAGEVGFERVGGGGGDGAFQVGDVRVEGGLFHHGPGFGQQGQDSGDGVGRDVQFEVVDGLEDCGAGGRDGLHEDQRDEAAEIGGDRDRAAVAGVGEGDPAVRDLPAVQALLQGLADRLLDGGVEGAREGTELGLDAIVDALGSGETRKPTAAAQGLSGAPISRYAVPTPSSRSTWIGLVSLKSTSRPYSLSSSEAMTSFCTSPYRLTVMSSALRTRISGSCSAS